MVIMSVVGARPNFMKVAPFIQAIHQHALYQSGKLNHLLIHTGQHYDERMSESFFRALCIPAPDLNLEIGSGSHAEQVGHTMIGLEAVIRKHNPDWLVVLGDVNAALAGAITAKKEQIKIAHIESGLRSFDMRMPEEVNRIVTDRLSDLLLCTDKIAVQNLESEGTPAARIRLVGNVMIDTLLQQIPAAKMRSYKQIIADNHAHITLPSVSLNDEGFCVVTLHRPTNVDEPKQLAQLVDFIVNEVCESMHVLWSIHPRTQSRLLDFGLMPRLQQNKNRLTLLHPLPYLDMLRLNIGARVFITDSGGLQEECCVLGTPCMTLRENTERPITNIEYGGTNVLAGSDVQRFKPVLLALCKRGRQPFSPPLWDGHAAERILQEILALRPISP